MPAGEAQIPDRLAYRLLRADDSHELPPPVLVVELREIRDRLESAARDRGWDPGPRLEALRDEVAERWRGVGRDRDATADLPER